MCAYDEPCDDECEHCPSKYACPDSPFYDDENLPKLGVIYENGWGD